jgi:hypothetical protein
VPGRHVPRERDIGAKYEHLIKYDPHVIQHNHFIFHSVLCVQKATSNIVLICLNSTSNIVLICLNSTSNIVLICLNSTSNIVLICLNSY